MAEFNLVMNFWPLILLLIGYFVGKWAESSHYASIRKREAGFVRIPVSSARTFAYTRPVKEARLVIGSMVVSVDYYKRFLAGLRSIFGGEMQSYSSLIDRGRREAILRMKESCPEADLFANFRLETSSLFKGNGKATGSVEVLAYSTAVVFANEAQAA